MKSRLGLGAVKHREQRHSSCTREDWLNSRVILWPLRCRHGFHGRQGARSKPFAARAEMGPRCQASESLVCVLGTRFFVDRHRDHWIDSKRSEVGEVGGWEGDKKDGLGMALSFAVVRSELVASGREAPGRPHCASCVHLDGSMEASAVYRPPCLGCPQGAPPTKHSPHTREPRRPCLVTANKIRRACD